jgi:hypothetical protein
VARIDESTRIHAPFDDVYGRVRDLSHWHRWFAGLGPPIAEGTEAVAYELDVRGHLFDVRLLVTEERIDALGARLAIGVYGAVNGMLIFDVTRLGQAVQVRVRVEWVVGNEPEGRRSDQQLVATFDRYAVTALNNLRLLCELKAEPEIRPPPMT